MDGRSGDFSIISETHNQGQKFAGQSPIFLDRLIHTEDSVRSIASVLPQYIGMGLECDSTACRAPGPSGYAAKVLLSHRVGGSTKQECWTHSFIIWIFLLS